MFESIVRKTPAISPILTEAQPDFFETSSIEFTRYALKVIESGSQVDVVHKFPESL